MEGLCIHNALITTSEYCLLQQAKEPKLHELGLCFHTQALLQTGKFPSSTKMTLFLNTCRHSYTSSRPSQVKTVVFRNEDAHSRSYLAVKTVWAMQILPPWAFFQLLLHELKSLLLAQLLVQDLLLGDAFQLCHAADLDDTPCFTPTELMAVAALRRHLETFQHYLVKVPNLNVLMIVLCVMLGIK